MFRKNSWTIIVFILLALLIGIGVFAYRRKQTN